MPRMIEICGCPGCNSPVFAGRLCLDHWRMNLESHEPTDVILSRAEAQTRETQEFETDYIKNLTPDQWTGRVADGWTWMGVSVNGHRFIRPVQK